MMQLDRTSIAIVLRSSQELLDLSLRVLREYIGRIATTGLAGAIPFAILNAIALEPLRHYDQLALLSASTTSDVFYRMQYLFWMALLVFLETPLAMVGLTVTLGHTVFSTRLKRSDWLLPLWKRRSAVVWILGVLRGALPALVLTVVMALSPDWHRSFSIITWLGLAALCCWIVRIARPFAPEILALELTPLKVPANTPNAFNYSKRTKWLQKATSDAGGLGISTSMFALLATLALYFCGAMLVGVLFGTWQWGWWTDLVIYPIALWSVAIWTAVVRFLAYMNTRIRAEGWDLELKLKAEAQRLGQQANAVRGG
jgi:hypothetical protein